MLIEEGSHVPVFSLVADLTLSVGGGGVVAVETTEVEGGRLGRWAAGGTLEGNVEERI